MNGTAGVSSMWNKVLDKMSNSWLIVVAERHKGVLCPEWGS
jgi:hypothetical protein